MAKTLTMNGQKKLATLQTEFTQKFPYLTLVFLDASRRSLPSGQTLAQVRTRKGEDLSIVGSLKVATFEARCADSFGLVVEVAYMRNGQLVHTPDTVTHTLSGLNAWCESRGYDRVPLAREERPSDTVQEALVSGIQVAYPDALVKKINTDHYVDLHLPTVHARRGTHLWFNTAPPAITFGYFVRDAAFVDAVLVRAGNAVERYSQGLRPAGAPGYPSVDSAVTAALAFLRSLTGKFSATNNSGTEEHDLEDLLLTLEEDDDHADGTLAGEDGDDPDHEEEADDHAENVGAAKGYAPIGGAAPAKKTVANQGPSKKAALRKSTHDAEQQLPAIRKLLAQDDLVAVRQGINLLTSLGNESLWNRFAEGVSLDEEGVPVAAWGVRSRSMSSGTSARMSLSGRCARRGGCPTFRG